MNGHRETSLFSEFALSPEWSFLPSHPLSLVSSMGWARHSGGFSKLKMIKTWGLTSRGKYSVWLRRLTAKQISTKHCDTGCSKIRNTVFQEHGRRSNTFRDREGRCSYQGQIKVRKSLQTRSDIEMGHEGIWERRKRHLKCTTEESHKSLKYTGSVPSQSLLW